MLAPQITEITAGHDVKGGMWTLTTARASHVQPQLECLAFRLESAEGSLCYSGDSGACEEVVELTRGCDVLIHMNHHYSGREPSRAYRAACGNHADNAVTAQRAGVKMLVLTHILTELDQPGVRREILQRIGRVFDGQVVWGEDLMQIDLKAGQSPRSIPHARQPRSS